MDIEQIRDYALSLEQVTEGFPFGETVLVFKVQGKIFLLLPMDSDGLQFNVKCEPELAIELRENYPDTVLPGYHMNKKHWNTVIVDGRLSGKQIREMIASSYQLVKGKKK
ncbi:MAG: MmcQ/YjbR family DNA-binding protein [Ferruginibacter sp.]|jgi:predicted DNA-binding protein (MmcQ/YjbR family)